jgi:hypothetical protein
VRRKVSGSIEGGLVVEIASFRSRRASSMDSWTLDLSASSSASLARRRSCQLKLFSGQVDAQPFSWHQDEYDPASRKRTRRPAPLDPCHYFFVCPALDPMTASREACALLANSAELNQAWPIAINEALLSGSFIVADNRKHSTADRL